MITADQLVAHAIGDYLLQSDWMAQNKSKNKMAALAHGATYMLPFLFFTLSPVALMVILVTHVLIDHYRLARYVCWAKNFLAPKWIEYWDGRHEKWLTERNRPWKQCDKTGYPDSSPAFMSVWLMIIADNVMHVIINGLALEYLS